MAILALFPFEAGGRVWNRPFQFLHKGMFYEHKVQNILERGETGVIEVI